MVIVNFEIGNKEFEVRSIRESGYPPTNNERGSMLVETVKLTENGLVRNWSNYAKVTKITRWLYIDDLLPKKGGKE